MTKTRTKIFNYTAALLLSIAGILNISCSKPNAGKPAEAVKDVSAEFSSEKKLNIVCTIFPEYDWVKNLTKDVPGVTVTILVHKGTDMHSYQAGAKDIVTIKNSGLFVFNGGESDKWIFDVLAVNPSVKAVNMMEMLGSTSVKNEELVEGMEAEEESEPSKDEHIWLSLRNAEKCCTILEKILEQTDSENSALYRRNLVSYITKLGALDGVYQNTLSFSSKDTLIFADRFPFRYLTDDYGLKYFAPFAGCSAETAASFETMTFLTKKCEEIKPAAVLVLEHSDKKLAQTVINNAKDINYKIKILEIDSIQSVTDSELKNGKNYLDLMKSNLEVLKEALN